MCEHFIARHYYGLTGDSSLSYSALEKADGDFVSFESISARTRSWIVASSDQEVPIEALSALEGKPRWSVNSYNNSVLNWAKEGKHTTFWLYEMKITSETVHKSLNRNKFIRPSGSYLPGGGSSTEEYQWFKKQYPEKSHPFEHVYVGTTKEDGRVGFLTVLIDEEKSAAYISGFEVFPKFRDQGHGTWILQTVLELLCIENGLKEVWLTVFCDNIPAVRLYMGLEFRVERPLWVVTSDD